jgi:2-C-methyl-D-erythritol 4-phosphate cytidylyltransferase / 2-C-methyl-D-erythritol 2,4-cyclodiphosphate synthase
VSAVIPAGGRGARFGAGVPKQLLPLAGRPILQRTIEVFLDTPFITEIAVALPPELAEAPPDYLVGRDRPIIVTAGGRRRQDSVGQAFACIADRADIVVVHDAARPLVTADLILRTVEEASRSGAAVAAVRAVDTVKTADDAGRVIGTWPRDQVYLVQTPQAFRTEILREALALGFDATDEAALVERLGRAVHVVDGDPANLKITTAADLARAERLLSPAAAAAWRVGTGYDLHRLVPGRPLVLGGLHIPFEKGLQGHSDADAVCHAITDALLGAAGQGDIGRHFPDTDPEWKDASSLDLLARAVALVGRAGFSVVNVDVVVIAQQPKIGPVADRMRARLADVLGCDRSQVSVKGKTNEGVDSTGAGESIAVHAVALIARA